MTPDEVNDREADATFAKRGGLYMQPDAVLKLVDHIRELEATNARLREALEPFAEFAPSFFKGSEFSLCSRDGKHIKVSDVHRAKEALEAR